MMPNPIVISNRNIVFVDPKEFDDPEVCDGLKDISNESMDFSNPKEFDDPQVFNDPNGISIGRMDFDSPKVCSDTSKFVGLVLEIFVTFCWAILYLHL